MRSSNFEVRSILQYTKIDNNSTIIPFIEILQQNNILIIVSTFFREFTNKCTIVSFKIEYVNKDIQQKWILSKKTMTLSYCFSQRPAKQMFKYSTKHYLGPETARPLWLPKILLYEEGNSCFFFFFFFFFFWFLTFSLI